MSHGQDMLRSSVACGTLVLSFQTMKCFAQKCLRVVVGLGWVLALLLFCDDVQAPPPKPEFYLAGYNLNKSLKICTSQSSQWGGTTAKVHREKQKMRFLLFLISHLCRVGWLVDNVKGTDLKRDLEQIKPAALQVRGEAFFLELVYGAEEKLHFFKYPLIIVFTSLKKLLNRVQKNSGI